MDARQRILTCITILAALVLGSGGPIQAQQAPQIKIVLHAGDAGARQVLVAHDARLIADYTMFSLWTVSGNEARALAGSSDALTTHTEFDHLVLRQEVLDTSGGATAEVGEPGRGQQLHLVQFAGPIRDEWLADLRTTGAQVVAYVPYNGYIVWSGEKTRAQIARRVAERVEYQWHGPYHPAYRLAAPLYAPRAFHVSPDEPDEPVDVVVQVVHHPGAMASVDEILARSEAVLQHPYRLLNTITFAARVRASSLPALAAQADVLNVEPWQAPRRSDERQGQILAGNLNRDATMPAGPGYLNWLQARGLPRDPASYPIVDVIDDGFDNGSASVPGHPDFYRLGSYGQGSRIAYARDLTGGGRSHSAGGHGTLNLSIVGGYNDRAGAAYRDAQGYQYGLGISPYGRLASTKVFDDQGNWAYFGSIVDLMQGSYSRGSRITNSSWSSFNNNYDIRAQAFDASTRDADRATPGNQAVIHVVSAGNAGPTAYSVGAPGTAKNVITVGASENVRPTGTDGCGYTDNEANNAQDIAAFSGRGPTADGRAKPDLVSPGTHVQGAASQVADYDGNGVCDLYWPAGQTLYTWSSGTSHASPAVAGALSLLYTYLEARGSTSPSPAMLKAILINSARYVNGAYGGGDLPSNEQGWGRADLGMALDGVPRIRVDQSVLFSASGQVYEQTGIALDPSKPLRVSLVWTDAPGTPVAAPWVNDLDLQVTVGGQTYAGNHFYRSTSLPGGTADSTNNVENVYLPAGMGGPLTVRVVAANIAGDGVPGNGDPTDQDFALVIYNAAARPDFSLGMSPANGQVCGTGQITYTVSVTAPPGYSYPVTLDYSDQPPGSLPAGVQIALAPTSGVPSYEARLSARTSVPGPAGPYTLIVTGTGPSGETRTVSATLAIDAGAPGAPLSLVSPTNGAIDVAPRHLLAWEAVPRARTYRVQIARDEAFTQLVVKAEVTSPSYQPRADLLPNTTYYWRVTAQNGCGSTASPAWALTTVNPVSLFHDTMEYGPDRWRTETVRGTVRWALSNAWAHSGTFAWHMVSTPQRTDARLEMAQPVKVDQSSTLSFWQWYDMESDDTGTAWDGGVIEISANGGPWQDLGPRILRTGYGHTVSSRFDNPLAGREAWSGNSDGWRRVEVDLGSYAGAAVRVRYRWGADTGNLGVYGGWYVDDVQITTIWPPSGHRLYLNAIYR